MKRPRTATSSGRGTTQARVLSVTFVPTGDPSAALGDDGWRPVASVVYGSRELGASGVRR